MSVCIITRSKARVYRINDKWLSAVRSLETKIINTYQATDKPYKSRCLVSTSHQLRSGKHFSYYMEIIAHISNLKQKYFLYIQFIGCKYCRIVNHRVVEGEKAPNMKLSAIIKSGRKQWRLWLICNDTCRWSENITENHQNKISLSISTW